jgi:hypothetical protein
MLEDNELKVIKQISTNLEKLVAVEILKLVFDDSLTKSISNKQLLEDLKRKSIRVIIK